MSTTTTTGPATTLAVGAVIELVTAAIETACPTEVWVSGEVAGVTRSRNGHLYFSLHPAGDTTISLGVAALGRDAGHLLWVLQKAGVTLADGQAVRVRGRLALYPRRGQVQFLATEIDPHVEAGQSERAVEALRSALVAQGQLDRQRALAVADLPLRVLVAGPAGQGTDDVCSVLARSPYAFTVTTALASIEAERGPQFLAEAVGRGAGHDVIVVARGGGAMIKGPFNSEWVCRAICASPVPVVVAVGHTSDRTLADDCAWRSVATPTAAGELLVGILEAAEGRLAAALESVERAASGVLVPAESRLAALVAGIEAAAAQAEAAHEARSEAVVTGEQAQAWRAVAMAGAGVLAALLVVLVVVFTFVVH